MATWAAKGDQKRLRAALESDLELLRQYWRFGVIHGAVLRCGKRIKMDGAPPFDAKPMIYGGFEVLLALYLWRTE